ncbi:hypothetical protein BDZ97DRAFT_238363 [Flammula alnicola]|nr:hypothetical protein BDZ97DRAFT_238363 [Flammula alnicola]
MSVITSFLHPTESQRGLALSRTRSSGNADVSVPPPRYSFLDGPLPPVPVATIPSETSSLTSADNDASPALPPRYSSVFRGSRTDRERRRERRRSGRANGYSSTNDRNASPSSSAPQLHEFHLRSGHGTKAQPWATLRVYSRSSAASASASSSSASSAAQKIPKFIGGDLVQGSLDLNLEAPQNINSINLSLRGRIVTSSYDGGSYTFLEHPIASWTRSNGDPRAMLLSPLSDASNSASLSNPRPKKFDGKLSGIYSWPFSFPFPTEIKLESQAGEQRAHPTPQTFSERDTKGNIQYELVLRMTHGILRSDSKLHTHVIYIPDITPAPASLFRQLAYGENMRVPGPEVDPLGWHTIPPAIVRGRLFAERNVKLQCALSVANPQSYTRGTVIPCHISIESNDTQALDVLASPKTIAVRLIRHVQYYEDGGQSLSPVQGKQKQAAVSIAVSDSSTSGGMIEDTMEEQRAVWWVNPDVGGQEGKKRTLEGEIHLEKELQPSCEFSLFKVSYAVELLPFETPVFQLSGSSSTSICDGDGDVPQALLSHPVTIATLHGEGPVPVPFTKPKPRSSKKIQAKTYNPGTMMMMGVSVYI